MPLLVVPWMTRLIHTRLLEKRRTEDGKRSRMDEMLSYLDSRWNGVYFENP